MPAARKLSIPLALAVVLLACGVLPGPPREAIPTREPPPPPSDTPVPTPVPVDTAVAPPTPGEWPCYENPTYGFSVCYPPEAALSVEGEDIARIDLPFAPGTNLREKWLDIVVRRGLAVCSSPQGPGYAPGSEPTERRVFPYWDFLVETGGDAGAGNYWEWVGYSTAGGDVCVSLTFILHSVNAMNYDPPIPEFDRAAESQVFEEILLTFNWWG